jgi:hypothetical protein
MRNPPTAIFALPDLGKPLVGLQGIAAGGDEIDDRIEIGATQQTIGRRGADFGIQFIRQERLAACAA